MHYIMHLSFAHKYFFFCKGRNKYRPGQRTPIPNLTMGGDWTSQKFLGSMEGAVLGGKLAAEVVSKKAKGMELPAEKEIQSHIVEAAASFKPKQPIGVKGEGAIAFGGGGTFTSKTEKLLKESDPAQFAA
jgi:15-cis-phytoene desaturase